MTETDTMASKRRGWLRPGLLDLFTGCLFLAIVGGYPAYMFDDPGVGWHLKTGQYVLNTGTVPRTDPFLFTREGEKWVANQWLAEVVGAWWYQRAGWIGLRFVTAVVIALTYGLLYRLLVEAGNEPVVAAALCIWAALAGDFHLIARPTVVTVLLLGYTYRRLWLYSEQKCSAKSLFVLVPAFLLWANLHGGVLAGLVMIGLALLAIIVRMVADRPDNARIHLGRAKPVGALGVCCFAATLVNPYGFGLYTWSWKLLQMKWIHTMNDEFRTMNFHQSGALRIELAILLLFVLVAIAKKRLSAFEILVTVFWLHQGIQTARFLVIFLWMVMLPLGKCITAFPWSGWLTVSQQESDPTSLLGRLTMRERNLLPGGLVTACVMALTGIALLVGPTFGLIESFGLNDIQPSKSTFPYGSVAMIKERAPSGVHIFHHPNWGGFVAHHLWPEHKAFLDDRNELCGKEAYEAFFDAYGGKPNWKQLFDKHEIRLALVGTRAPLRHILQAHPDWKLVFEKQPEPAKDGRKKGEGEALFWHRSLRPVPETRPARSD